MSHVHQTFGTTFSCTVIEINHSDGSHAMTVCISWSMERDTQYISVVLLWMKASSPLCISMSIPVNLHTFWLIRSHTHYSTSHWLSSEQNIFILQLAKTRLCNCWSTNKYTHTYTHTHTHLAVPSPPPSLTPDFKLFEKLAMGLFHLWESLLFGVGKKKWNAYEVWKSVPRSIWTSKISV